MAYHILAYPTIQDSAQAVTPKIAAIYMTSDIQPRPIYAKHSATAVTAKYF